MGARLIAVAAAAFVLALSAAAAAAPAARLSSDVVPVAYDLTIAPDIETSRTTGHETVDVAVLRPAVDAIALNARALVISRAAIDGRAARVELMPAIEQIRLRTGSPLAAGRHRIELEFAGRTDGGDGASGLFYEAGAEPHLATLFEPSMARMMFPCFDEPAFRARFTLHVVAPSPWTVVSNMPLRGRHELAGGLARSDFATTPPMPAYVLTLAAGVYVHVDGMAGQVPIRVFVRPGQEPHARQILADVRRLVPFYERFFGTPFALPKLDVVVASGVLHSAFEGWGAVTYFTEEDVFGNQYRGAEAGRRYAAELLAHEIAHQWAGDLVTMRWWRDTFVSEGLAQFAQREAMRAVFPELDGWRDDDRSVAGVMRSASKPASRPVLRNVLTDLDADADAVFDPATYDEGASVIAGWRDAVGERTFHDGLVRYLREFAGVSETVEDFWGFLGGANATAYGRSWLAQRGFPVVDVRTRCDGRRAVVALAQTPFVSDEAVDAAYRAQRWIVPVPVRIGGEQRSVVLASARATVRFAHCGDVAIAPGARPFYLVRYDESEYGTLARGIGGIDQRERQRLYRDALMLHSAGALADSAFLRLIATAREPLDADVWTAIAQEYGRLDGLVRGTPESAVLGAMQTKALLPLATLYTRIGFTGRVPFRLATDPALALAELGDPTVGALFRDDYLAIEAGGPVANPQAPWLTGALAGSTATSADVDRVEAALRPSTRSQNAGAEWPFLINVRDEALARRVLDDAMRDDLVPRDRRLGFVFGVGSRHPQVGYAYLRAHIAELKQLVPPTQQAWTIAMATARTLWPAAPPDEIERFLRASFPAEPNVVREARRVMLRNWRERDALRRALRAASAL